MKHGKARNPWRLRLLIAVAVLAGIAIVVVLSDYAGSHSSSSATTATPPSAAAAAQSSAAAMPDPLAILARAGGTPLPGTRVTADGPDAQYVGRSRSP